MRPKKNAKERFAALKATVRGSWFRMKKLKDLVDKEIADANQKAVRIREGANRYTLDAEIFESALKAFQLVLKEGEPVPEKYQAEYKTQVNISGNFQDEALNLLIANNRRKWTVARNEAGKRGQAAHEWERYAKRMQAELDELGRQVAANV